MASPKMLGGILLIVGTSIGGGMLALPVSTAEIGFVNSLFLLIACWFIMTMGALLLLEVNIRLPVGSNIISMARFTFGIPGQVMAWFIYLFLLYTLLAAYISGGSDVFQNLLHQIGMHFSSSLTSLLFTALFSLVVYAGIKSVDYVNRGFMFGKLGVYCLLVLIILPHVDSSTLTHGSLKKVTNSLMILITSFGFASIIPTLRDYFEDDIPTLRKAIIFGSLIPLLCYIIWDATIMGVIPREGENGLIYLLTAGHTASGLTTALNHATSSSLITHFFSFFTSICMITAFLGVSIGLFDFLADGLTYKKTGQQGKRVLLLTFLPPLMIVLIKPGIYLHALGYAGFCCVILLLLLPALMAWRIRKDQPKTSQLVPGGTLSLCMVILVSIFLLCLSLL